MRSIDMLRTFAVTITALALATVMVLDTAYCAPGSRDSGPFTGSRSYYVDIDGHTIHYQKAGQGPPIILVHGFGAWSFTWRKNIAPLSKHHTVYALDLLGFGLSDKPAEGPYSISGQAELTLNFMDAIGLDRAILIGNSLGGEIALAAALDRPEKVRALILIDSSGFKDTPRIPQWLNPSALRVILTMLITNRMQIEHTLKTVYYSDALVSDYIIEGYRLPTATHGVSDALLGMARQLKIGMQRDRYREVAQPTLVLWGEEDEVLPLHHALMFRRVLPESRLVIIPDAGHAPHEERPGAVNSHILNFIEELDSSL